MIANFLPLIAIIVPMRISIVIPAYNEEKYLPHTLQSIQKLLRKPDEVIVIDGESTDQTGAIAKQFGAKVIRIPKTTIGAARQAGLAAATCDIIATTDADTIVPTLWLNKIETALTEPGVVGVYSGYRVPDGRLFYRFIINVVHPFIFFLSQWWERPIGSGQNTAYLRKAALAAGGYPTRFQSVEDIELMRRLKRIGKIRYLHNNYVSSSGRRGNEGIAFLFRMTVGLWRYYKTGSAETFSFPNIR